MPRPSAPIRAAPSPLRVYLLGRFRIESEAGPIRLPTRKVESLLACLVLHPEPHSRAKLASLFWGNVTDAQALHSLRTALNILRKQLGDRLLLADRETIQLNPAFPLWVDTLEFQKDVERLGELSPEGASHGFDLYPGDLLADFYDDWILPEREHYRQQYLGALLQVTQRLRSQSEYDRAIEFAQAVLAQDPANERAHQQLMFCYLASGDRTAALEQFEACRRALQEELAVEPSPETVALSEWIKQAHPEAKTREGLITNLPIPLTTFIGRKQEMAHVKSLLSGDAASRRTTRLLTLIGAGGSGKTRLAIQVGMDLLESFKDGVWWVDLAPLVEATLVPQAAARALGVRERPNEPLIETLKDYLLPRQLLLLLDNCEHLVGACAQLAQILLTMCLGLKILATSRESLGLAGETVWYVPTLSVPDLKQLPPISELNQYDAIQLFSERAAMVKPEFALTEQNASSVVQLCTQLDGIPLAIELSAARMKVLTVEQIAERLVDRFNLLTGGSRTALPRHRTLRATLDWSYNLLSDQERILFQRLSVFAGGWTIEAAEVVCTDGEIRKAEVLDLLSQLVDKSLVIVQGHGSEAHYRMLETLCQYGGERLAESGAVEQIRHHHVLHFAALAEKAEQGLRNPEMRSWVERLELEHDNFRAALEWSLHHESPETCLRFASALGIFWRKRGYLREGRAWLERLLARGIDAPPQLRVKAMAPAGWLVRDLGDYERAIALQEESLEIFRAAGDQLGTVEVLIQRGILAVYQNDLPRAFACFGESLALCEEFGYGQGRALALVFLGHAALFNMQWDAQAKARCEQALEVFKELDDKTEQAHAHIILGTGAHFEGDDNRARAHLEQAVRLCRQAGDKRQLGWSTTVLSLIIRWQGRFDEALPLAKEGLRLALELGEKTIAVNAIVFLALLAKDQGQMEQATRLSSCAFALGESFGFRPTPHVEAIINPELDAMRAVLGEEAFVQAWAEGRAMKSEQAIDLALSVGG